MRAGAVDAALGDGGKANGLRVAVENRPGFAFYAPSQAMIMGEFKFFSLARRLGGILKVLSRPVVPFGFVYIRRVALVWVTHAALRTISVPVSRLKENRRHDGGFTLVFARCCFALDTRLVGFRGAMDCD
jgi:hypothetical protein